MAEFGDLWDYSLGSLESFHAEVGRVADRTGCKRKECDDGDSTTVSSRVKALPEGVHGPCNAVQCQYKNKTTMASSIATRLVGHAALRDDVDFSIPCRAAARMKLAPEKGGGRVTGERSTPKLGMPENTGLSVVQEFVAIMLECRD